MASKTEDRDIEGSELSAIVSKELVGAVLFDQQHLAGKRATALQYIRGEMPDLPGRKNGSQQTDRTIADVIAWVAPGIMRTMMASDQMVRFASVKDEPPEWAEQATAYTNWDFLRNGGYGLVESATKDSLGLGVGVVRCYFEEEEGETKLLRGKTFGEIVDELDLTPDEVGMLKAGAPLDAVLKPKGISVLSQRERAQRTPEADPLAEPSDLLPVRTFDLKVRMAPISKICDELCKPENLMVNASAVSIETARFVGYLHDDYTRSDLVEMGFDKTVVNGLQATTSPASNEISLSRVPDGTWTKRDSPVKSGDLINTYECYIKADADGDGIAETLQVWYAGTPGSGEVLGWDYWDEEIPFTDIPCYPVPHSRNAESVADRTMDIQRVQTVLIRALLDSTYHSVLPQRVAQEGTILNPDALFNPRFGSTLWSKKGTPASEAIHPLTLEYTGDKALVAMQYMQDMVARRTGVSRQTMALDPEALTNQTATASREMRDAGYSQIELIARNMAELGWTKYFSKRLKLAIKHKIIARVPMKQKAQPAPPQAMPPQQGAPVPPQMPKPQAPEFQVVRADAWDENMAVSINTGLGTGSRDRDMAMIKVMLGMQVDMAQRLAGTGLPSAKQKALEFLPKILNSAVLLAESAGIKDPSEHFPEITQEDVLKMGQEAEAMAKQGDPAVKLEQMRGQTAVQVAQANGQTTLQVEQGKNQIAQQQAVTDSQVQVRREQAQLEADLQTKAADRQKDLDLANIDAALQREKMDREDTYRYAKLAQDKELALISTAAQQHQADQAAASAPAN